MSTEKSTSKVVYVLDDDPSVLKAIHRLLTSAGIKVCGFTDPTEFLTSVQAHVVPVAVLDVWMEQMTGLEVQSKLARLSPQTQMIVMTGRGDAGVKQTATDLGAAAYFVKPFDDEEFISAIQTALQGENGGQRDR
jgi:FixJ family two-component response regulator